MPKPKRTTPTLKQAERLIDEALDAYVDALTATPITKRTAEMYDRAAALGLAAGDKDVAATWRLYADKLRASAQD